MTKKLLGALSTLAAIAVAGVALADVPAACTGITFTRNLYYGISGADVKCLQALLNQDSDTQVAATGPGSPGNETTYFGPLTRAAVIKFQEKYAADVLAPLGLSAGTGFVGPKTRAKLNELLTTPTQPTQPTQPTEPTQPTQPEEEEVIPEEGTLELKRAVTPYGVEVKAGDQNVAVTAFTLKAIDSAITVQRIDAKLPTDIGGNKPYKVLSYLALYEGENALKGVTLSKDTVSTEGVVRFSGLNLKIAKGETKTINIKVSLASTLPSGAEGETVTITIPKDGVRGVDTAGLNVYAPSTSTELNSFKIVSVPTPVAKISLASDTPKEGVVIASKESETEVELARYVLKVEKAETKVVGFEVGVEESTTTILETRIYDGDNLLCIVGENCNEIDVAMAKDASKTFTIKALVKKAPVEGATLKVTAVTSTYYSDLEEETEAYATTTTASNPIHLYTIAPIISNVSAYAEAKDLNATTGAESLVGRITFSVTAKGGDVWVSSTIDMMIEKSDGSTSFAITDYVITTSAPKEANGYKVAENQTVSFTINFTKAGGSAGYWRVVITKLNWHNGTDVQNYSGALVEELKTDYVYLTAD